MYHKLARGYATQFINQQIEHARIDAWMNGPTRNRALNVLEESSKSKKPGRVCRRIHQVIRPHFAHPGVLRWDKKCKALLSYAITAAQESAVFSLTDLNRELYTERALFLSHLCLKVDDQELVAMLANTANISHHAITRLFEREASTEDTIERDVYTLLEIAFSIYVSMENAKIDHSRSHAILIPYKEGALPAVTMEVLPNASEPTSRRRVIAIRTFLDKSMLSHHHHERMGGFQDALEASRRGSDTTAMVRWIETNVRPFDYISQSERTELMMTNNAESPVPAATVY